MNVDCTFILYVSNSCLLSFLTPSSCMLVQYLTTISNTNPYLSYMFIAPSRLLISCSLTCLIPLSCFILIPYKWTNVHSYLSCTFIARLLCTFHLHSHTFLLSLLLLATSNYLSLIQCTAPLSHKSYVYLNDLILVCLLSFLHLQILCLSSFLLSLSWAIVLHLWIPCLAFLSCTLSCTFLATFCHPIDSNCLVTWMAMSITCLLPLSFTFNSYVHHMSYTFSSYLCLFVQFELLSTARLKSHMCPQPQQ